MTVLLANNVSSALAASITASATSMTVTDGSRFPVLSAGQYFYATIIATNGIVEIVKVNTRNGNAMSITRAQDGTNAQAFVAGARVEMRINAASVRDTVTDQTGPLDTRLTTAEGDITSLEGRMTTAEGDITSLEGRMTTAEGDIVALEAFDTTLGTSAGSNSVGFLQAGSGATARTVQGKLRDVVSVLDFGADPTGATNSSTAVQAAIDSIVALGGTLVFPRGKYLFTSQVTIDRKYAAYVGGTFVGERNLIISGYGAEIRTSGAITAFEIRGGWLPNINCRIEGFTIYHRGNTTAVGGIRLINAGAVTCYEISVVVSSSLPVGYAAFSCENLDPANDDTGCFWNYFDNCVIRPWAGAEGNCTFGIKLMGTANATTVRNVKFSGSNTHIILMAHPGYTSAPNAVNIDGNFFEGPTTSTAISLVSSSSPYHIAGTRITNNRFEAINTAISITGLGTTVQLPTYTSGNYADTAVTNYVVNPSDIPIVMLDAVLVGAPMGPMKTHNQQGVLLRNDDAAANVLTLRAANLNRGLSLQTYTGVDLGLWRFSNAMGGSGTIIGGTWSPYRPFGIVACQGIATRDTPANNLAGQANLNAATTVAVTFPVAEVNDSYVVFLEHTANRTLWVTNKTTAGFTINASSSVTANVGWMIIRIG